MRVRRRSLGLSFVSPLEFELRVAVAALGRAAQPRLGGDGIRGDAPAIPVAKTGAVVKLGVVRALRCGDPLRALRLRFLLARFAEIAADVRGMDPAGKEHQWRNRPATEHRRL